MAANVMLSSFLLGIAILLCIPSVPAFAYTPHIGDRAAPLSGRDIAGGDTVSLEDYLGSWVLVDFWRSDCGPCLSDMPLIQAAAEPYRAAGKLELLLVNLDKPGNAADMKRVLREHRVDCPVIYCGGMSQIVGLEEQPEYVAPQAREWNIRGVPATFLIDPQGVIVAKHLRRELAKAALDYFLNLDAAYEPVGLRTCYSIIDGDQVELTIEVSNPRRTPLELEVDYALISADIIDYQGMTIPTNRQRLNPVEGGPEQLLSVSFDAWSDATEVIVIDAAGYQGVDYRVRVLLPGTEHLLDGEGLWIKQFGNIYFGFPSFTYESS